MFENKITTPMAKPTRTPRMVKFWGCGVWFAAYFRAPERPDTFRTVFGSSGSCNSRLGFLESSDVVPSGSPRSGAMFVKYRV